MTPIKSSSIYKKYQEKIDTDFEGTIIDIETIGEFTKVGFGTLPLGTDYLQRYKEMKITTVGTLSEGKLTIRIANDSNNLLSFQSTAIRKMRESLSPLYAFSKPFEEGCYYWNSNYQFLEIDYELQGRVYEKKQVVTNSLAIRNYSDPFHGDGGKCKDAFLSGDLDKVVAHNRACLLKENQILLKRGAKKIATKWLDASE